MWRTEERAQVGEQEPHAHTQGSKKGRLITIQPVSLPTVGTGTRLGGRGRLREHSESVSGKRSELERAKLAPPPPLRADRSAGGKATPRPTSVASASGAAAPIATLNVQMLQTGSYSPDEGLAVLGEAALRPAFSSSCLAPIMAALTLSSHVANGLKCGSLTTAIASCSLRNLSYDPGRSVPKRGHGRTTQGQRRGVHRRRNLG